MRVLVISDIHANLAAFEAVLEESKGEWDVIWFLGDLVGYGPDPNECVELLREQEHFSLSGNHDWAYLGRLDLDTFNEDARRAIRWTQEAITEENREYINELGTLDEVAGFTLAHASPRHPVWEYILDESTAEINFEHFDGQVCLVGHTHVPIIYSKENEVVYSYPPTYDLTLDLRNSHRMIINPGSVGQPRDSDPRASYAILDLDKMDWQHHRVPYPVAETQAKMRKHKMPKRLIIRLDYGW